MSEKVETSRVTMLWPVTLKDAVREKVGARGLTDFAVAAVRNHLDVADKQASLEKEVNELKYLAQLLADRLALGGDIDDRREALMEIDLPHWIETTGWPSEFAGLVKPEVVHPQPLIDVLADFDEDEPVPFTVVDEEPGPTTAIPIPEPERKQYTDEELNAPSYAVAKQTTPPVVQGKSLTIEPLTDTPDLPHDAGAGDDMFARLQKVMAAKGVDVSDSGLVPASSIKAPERPAGPHNHAFESREGVLGCACGAWIDESAGKPGVVRESGWRIGDATEPAPELEVQPDAATPLPNDDSPATLAGQPNPFAGPDATGADPFPAVASEPEPAIADSDVCPECKSELVAGECWTCF